MTTIQIKLHLGDESFGEPMIDCFSDQDELDFIIRNLKRKMSQQREELLEWDREYPMSATFKEWSEWLSGYIETSRTDKLNFTI